MTNIICLTEIEIETFFPGDRISEAKALMDPCVSIDPGEFECDGDWGIFIEDNKPEIILSAWSMRGLPANALELAPSFRYLCYVPGSVRSKAPRSLIEKGLKVSNWNASISRTISECALLLILGCLRRVSYWTREMHCEGAWKDASATTQSLFGRRVGIHGFGQIAQKLIPLLRPFTDRISAYSPGVPQSIFEDLAVSRAESLEGLFSESDVVVELEALTEESYRIVTEELLRSIPEGGVFVNTGRADVVDEDALIRVAKEGNLQIGLDVYWQEPLPKDSPLRGMPNVLLLPHLAGPTTDRTVDAGDFALDNLRRYRNSENVIGVIDLEVYDRST